MLFHSKYCYTTIDTKQNSNGVTTFCIFTEESNAKINENNIMRIKHDQEKALQKQKKPKNKTKQ